MKTVVLTTFCYCCSCSFSALLWPILECFRLFSNERNRRKQKRFFRNLILNEIKYHDIVFKSRERKKNCRILITEIQTNEFVVVVVSFQVYHEQTKIRNWLKKKDAKKNKEKKKAAAFVGLVCLFRQQCCI